MGPALSLSFNFIQKLRLFVVKEDVAAEVVGVLGENAAEPVGVEVIEAEVISVDEVGCPNAHNDDFGHG